MDNETGHFPTREAPNEAVYEAPNEAVYSLTVITVPRCPA